MKLIGLRHIHGVSLGKVFSARLMGGERGINDGCNALETYSNEIAPTIRTMPNFTLVVQPYEC